jgi:ribonuclease HI
VSPIGVPATGAPPRAPSAITPSAASCAIVAEPAWPVTCCLSLRRPPSAAKYFAAVKLVVHVDGGARGNPGPAAAACVVATADGQALAEDAVLLGRTTNNVAEYRALLLGLQRARELGADDVEVIGDSELIAKQVLGQYKVKNDALRSLHREATAALRAFDHWSIRTVPRAQNADADALVNAALDQQRDASAL